MKESRKLQSDLRELRATVDKAEKELAGLAEIASQAKQQNGLVRRDLAVLKPYGRFNEQENCFRYYCGEAFEVLVTTKETAELDLVP